MIKLKTLLSEAYAWERQEGKSLPTLAEVQAAYDAKMRKDVDPEEEGHVYEEPPYDEEDDDMYESKAAKDYDGDGEIESGSEEYLGSVDKAIKASANSTEHGNYINKARAKSHLTKKDGHVYGITDSGKGHKITNVSDLDQYNKFTIKSINENSDMNSGYQYLPIGTKVEFQGKTGTIQDHVSYRHGDVYYKIDYDSGDDEIVVPRDTRLKKLGESKQTMKESFWKRVNGNLHGHEHILREAFKRK